MKSQRGDPRPWLGLEPPVPKWNGGVSADRIERANLGKKREGALNTSVVSACKKISS